MARVLVVGAGVAGLTCAWRLARAGHDVEVLEREAAPGGRMRSERHGDFLIERGAQFIASAYHNLHQVVRSLELDGQVRVLEPASNAVLRDGRLVPAAFDTPSQLLRSPLLSRRSKLRLLRLAAQLLRHRRSLHPLEPERAAPLDRESLADHLGRVVGEEALEFLFAPAFSSTFDSDPENLSGAFGLLMLRFVLGGFRLQYLDGGMGTLTRRLADAVPLRLGWEVTAIESDPGGARVRYVTPSGERTREADAVVVAVPGARVASLCPKLSCEEQAFFAQVRYARGIIVHLLFDEAPTSLPGYGLAFPRSAGLDLYGLAVDHHKAGVAPRGSGLVNAALTETAAARLTLASDEEVQACVLGELARTPVGRLAPREAVVHRWESMLPQFRTGYLRALADFLARTERTPKLVFASDYLVGPTTEAALTSGLRAATETALLLGGASGP